MAIESVINSASDLIAEVNKMQVSTLLKPFSTFIVIVKTFRLNFANPAKNWKSMWKPAGRKSAMTAML